MDNPVRRDALVRTAHRSVSVIMEESVRHPQDSVCAVQDTQERGAKISARLAHMVSAAARHVAV